jgi:AraC-like DNA-binding protein
MFKNYCKNKLRYGRKEIDFQDGSLICVAPNQVIELDSDIEIKDDMIGWGLFFHPDLIRGTVLQDNINKHGYFSYDVTEALHLSEKERTILFECVQSIDEELNENIDVHSQNIIVSNIDLLLNYCLRYYGRQMITRSHSNKSVINKVEFLLRDHFRSEASHTLGWPSVAYLAEKVHLSPSYLSDLLKSETGKTAQEHIHYHLIEAAKDILISSDKTISEIALQLGFAHPNYFNKLFKSKTGRTPVEFRNRIDN